MRLKKYNNRVNYCITFIFLQKKIYTIITIRCMSINIYKLEYKENKLYLQPEYYTAVLLHAESLFIQYKVNLTKTSLKAY